MAIRALLPGCLSYLWSIVNRFYVNKDLILCSATLGIIGVALHLIMKKDV